MLTKIKELIMLWMIKNLSYKEFIIYYMIHLEETKICSISKSRDDRVDFKLDPFNKDPEDFKESDVGHIEAYLVYLIDYTNTKSTGHNYINDYMIYKFKQEYLLCKILISKLEEKNGFNG